jgi:hypothetical protein
MLPVNLKDDQQVDQKIMRSGFSTNSGRVYNTPASWAASLHPLLQVSATSEVGAARAC